MSNPYPVSTNGLSSVDLDNDSSIAGDVNSSKKSNALSNKLTSVLSSSYVNAETRDALRLLDARGAQNAEETRINLKSDAQKEVIDANARIVEDFGKVANQLKRVGALITILNQTCDDMRSHIQSARQDTAPMLEEASTLLARKQETESKQQLLNAFNQHFLVSDEDLTTLTSSAEPVNDRFFVILSRVKQIHKDCEILLGYENQRLGLELMEQTTRNLDAGYKKLYNWIQREFKGLDLEDPHISGSIRRSLRALSERPTLFQNCLDFFGEARQATLSEAFRSALTDSTLGGAGASKAIEFSTHDPLRYIGDMLAWVHSTTVSEKEALEGLFISDADEISRGLMAGKSSEPWARLRRTSTANGAAPIGDEDEDDEEDTEGNRGDAASSSSSFDGHAALNSLISRNMSSVAQILSQRISLTIRNLSDAITIYKSYNLLLFYHDTFIKLLGATNLNSQTPKIAAPSQQSQLLQSQNSLLSALVTLQTQTLTHFQDTVSEDVESHAQSAVLEADGDTGTAPYSASLQPPGILPSNLVLFASILRLRAPNLTNAEFTSLYSTLIAPVLQLCDDAASSFDSAPAGPEQDHPGARDGFEATVFRLNYLHRITSTFASLAKEDALAPFIAPPMRGAAQQVEKLTDDLAEAVTERFLAASGVRGLLDLIDQANKSQSATAAAAGDVDTVRAVLLEGRLEDASAALDAFLASALMDAQDELGRLTDKAVAKTVVADAVDEFCDEFESLARLFEGLDGKFEESNGGRDGKEQDADGESGAEDDVLLRDLYPRTVAEVRALLS